MIFPDWGTNAADSAARELPLYTEWAVDWETGGFALRDGKPYTVTGAEALKTWVRCALHPESRRFLFSAHSADYGNQIADYLSESAGEGILESLLTREIQDTLLVCPYIRQVDGFSFTRQGSRLTVDFTVHTVYEDFSSNTEVLTP